MTTERRYSLDAEGSSGPHLRDALETLWWENAGRAMGVHVSQKLGLDVLVVPLLLSSGWRHPSRSARLYRIEDFRSNNVRERRGGAVPHRSRLGTCIPHRTGLTHGADVRYPRMSGRRPRCSIPDRLACKHGIQRRGRNFCGAQKGRRARRSEDRGRKIELDSWTRSTGARVRPSSVLGGDVLRERPLNCMLGLRCSRLYSDDFRRPLIARKCSRGGCGAF